MDTEVKALEVKEMDDSGQGLARIATMSAIDGDGDTYERGAFNWNGEQWAHILPAHNPSATPLGKARVYEDNDAAYAALHLNLETEAGRDWHKSLMFDLKKGTAIQEWSFGFRVVDSGVTMQGGQRVRVLKRLKVYEVSPVVIGAGLGTGTLAMKSRQEFGPQIDTMIAGLDDIINRAGDIKSLREGEGRSPLSATRLDQLKAMRERLETLIDTTGEKSAVKTAEVPDVVREAERNAIRFLTMSATGRFGD